MAEFFDDDDLSGIDFVTREEADSRKKTRAKMARRKKAEYRGHDDLVDRQAAPADPAEDEAELDAAEAELDAAEREYQAYAPIIAETHGQAVAEAVAPKRGRGRPRKNPALPKPGGDPDDPKSGGPSIHEGVTVHWLADAFGISRDTVKRRISGLRPVGTRKGAKLYDFAAACNVIATPKVDLIQAVRRLSPTDIPIWLNKNFWQAMNEKLAFAEKSGDLWPSDRVISSIAEILKVVRRRMLALDSTIEKGARDGKSVSDVIRGVMIELEDEMQKAAMADPLSAYRTQLYNDEKAAIEALDAAPPEEGGADQDEEDDDA